MPSESHRYWGQTSKLRNHRSCARRLHILHHFIQVLSFRDRRGIFDIHFFLTRSFLCWGSSRCHDKQKCRTLKLWNRTVTQKQMSTWRQVQIQSSQMVYGWKRLSKQLLDYVHLGMISLKLREHQPNQDFCHRRSSCHALCEVWGVHS